MREDFLTTAEHQRRGSNLNFGLLLKNGLVVWLNDSEAAGIKTLLQSESCPRFLGLGNNTVSVSSVDGVYGKSSIDEISMLKSGLFKCHAGEWHKKWDKCSHPTAKDIEARAKFDEKVAAYVKEHGLKPNWEPPS
jgi:hypothetical protein